MTEFFKNINKITYQGPDSDDLLSFKHYNPEEEILGKTMQEHLRFAVCYWHTFTGDGTDMFGSSTISRDFQTSTDPMEQAKNTMRAAFEFFEKLGVKFWCFHDRDIAPEADDLSETNKRLDTIVSLAEELQNETGITPLWGTSNMFSNPRFMAGAATNPSPRIFAYAASQVKKALDITNRLGGQGYVFWGGREGYDTLLNTDMEQELDHLARFLHMAVEYKNEIGFEGRFYIEPKPKEPTKHQYDFDAAACYAFLQKYGLQDDFKLNIEANHATLAGHTFEHELTYSAANGILGSVDANRGDTLLGWDTDQFPTDIYQTTKAMYAILNAGGFTTGGLNFDAKLRRQSISQEDLFHAHIGAMDAFARGLKIAAAIIRDSRIDEFKNSRYAEWGSELGRNILDNKLTFEDLETFTVENGEPPVQSGRQEMLENIFNSYM